METSPLIFFANQWNGFYMTATTFIFCCLANDFFISFISFFSVVGFNFDFLCYSITGFVCYSVFNVGLFYVKMILVN